MARIIFVVMFCENLLFIYLFSTQYKWINTSDKQHFNPQMSTVVLEAK